MTRLLLSLLILTGSLVVAGCRLSGLGEETEFPPPPSYRGIVPGKTTAEEVRSILGEPDDTSEWEPDDAWSWTYYDLRVLVVLSLEDHIVKWVRIRDQAHTLGEIIDMYGEPERTTLTDPYECFPDNYSVTNLDYPGNGASAILWRITPYSKDYVVTDLIYFEPMTMEAYFEYFGQDPCQKVIEWPGFEAE